MDETSTLLFKDEVYAVVGAAIEVHRELGPGFLEAVYQEALERELCARAVSFRSQCPFTIVYKGEPLARQYVADLICVGQIVVELKAVDRLSRTDAAQLLNYLKATGLKVGLLINFRSNARLEWKRFVM
jgi:GxxExxY protein